MRTDLLCKAKCTHAYASTWEWGVCGLRVCLQHIQCPRQSQSMRLRQNHESLHLTLPLRPPMRLPSRAGTPGARYRVVLLQEPSCFVAPCREQCLSDANAEMIT